MNVLFVCYEFLVHFNTNYTDWKNDWKMFGFNWFSAVDTQPPGWFQVAHTRCNESRGVEWTVGWRMRKRPWMLNWPQSSARPFAWRSPTFPSSYHAFFATRRDTHSPKSPQCQCPFIFSAFQYLIALTNLSLPWTMPGHGQRPFESFQLWKLKYCKN